jgi:1,4-alpha-glucan branching enzyme
VLAILLPQRGTAPPDPGAIAGGGVVEVVYVQFVLDAPTATSVAVAGDFTDWQPEFTLDDSDGDGVWSGRIPIRPGVHGYMFLIDETEWRTDPNAGRYQDDGFGNRNAVLAVGASG